MLAVLFGSYSIAAPFAGILPLSLLKSITRRSLLWPPPTQRTVTLPALFLPPVFLMGAGRPFSGLFLSTSKTSVVFFLMAGEVGLNFFTGIVLSFPEFYLTRPRRSRSYRLRGVSSKPSSSWASAPGTCPSSLLCRERDGY